MIDKDSPQAEKDYFEKFARGFTRALSLHRNPGTLFKGDFSIGKSWGGVSEHCLMEAARAQIWGDKLKLDEEIVNDLITAVLLHDFYKRYEIEAINKDIESGCSGRKGVLRVGEETVRILKKAGFGGRILKIIQAAGAQPEALFLVKSILDDNLFSDEQIACLIMYYVDAYTRGSEWVLPAEKNSAREIINDLDRRVERNIENPRYQKMSIEAPGWHRGHAFFEGKTTFEAMLGLGRLVEEKLAELIKERNKENISPLKLPEEIDRVLKEKIKSN